VFVEPDARWEALSRLRATWTSPLPTSAQIETAQAPHSSNPSTLAPRWIPKQRASSPAEEFVLQSAPPGEQPALRAVRPVRSRVGKVRAGWKQSLHPVPLDAATPHSAIRFPRSFAEHACILIAPAGSRGSGRHRPSGDSRSLHDALPKRSWHDAMACRDRSCSCRRAPSRNHPPRRVRPFPGLERRCRQASVTNQLRHCSPGRTATACRSRCSDRASDDPTPCEYKQSSERIESECAQSASHTWATDATRRRREEVCTQAMHTGWLGVASTDIR
jgi:hypothetical protein